MAHITRVSVQSGDGARVVDAKSGGALGVGAASAWRLEGDYGPRGEVHEAVNLLASAYRNCHSAIKRWNAENWVYQCGVQAERTWCIRGEEGVAGCDVFKTALTSIFCHGK
jgi:hypothetical protein